MKKAEWITRNLWAKTGAFILAVSLWFYVAGEERIETSLDIPLRLKPAKGMVVTEQNTKEISVFISGYKDLVKKLSATELTADIDLSGYTEPQRITLPVEKRFLPFPQDVAVFNIKPAHISVKIDRRVCRVLPVHVVTEGAPAAGYRAAGIVIDPVSARISGPEAYINKMDYVNTEPVDITGRRKSFKKMVPLAALPACGERSPPQFIEAVIKIEKIEKIQKRR